MPFVLETIIGRRRRPRHCFRSSEKSSLYKIYGRQPILSLKNHRRRRLIYVENCTTTQGVFTDFAGELYSCCGRQKSPTSVESRNFSVRKKSRRFAPLTLVCWNFLSVLLFLLALGVSNASGNNNNNLRNVNNNNNNNKQYNFRNKQYDNDRYPNHNRYLTTSNSLKNPKGPYHKSLLHKLGGPFSYSVGQPYERQRSMAPRRHNFGRGDWGGSRGGSNGNTGRPRATAAKNKGLSKSSLTTTGSTTPLVRQNSSTCPRNSFPSGSKLKPIEKCYMFLERNSSELCPSPPSLSSSLSHREKAERQSKHDKLKWERLKETYLFAFESGQLNLVKFFNAVFKTRYDNDSLPSKIEIYRGLKDEYKFCIDPWKKKKDCEKCFDSLRPSIAELTNDFNLFDKRVLSKFECTTTKIEKVYSSTTDCSSCRVLYARWLLVTRTSLMVKRPCIEWCELVELACPHVTPAKKHQETKKDLEHAGLPSFRCRDNTIPWKENPNSTYGGQDNCYAPCDFDKKSRVGCLNSTDNSTRSRSKRNRSQSSSSSSSANSRIFITRANFLLPWSLVTGKIRHFPIFVRWSIFVAVPYFVIARWWLFGTLPI